MAADLFHYFLFDVVEINISNIIFGCLCMYIFHSILTILALHLLFLGGFQLNFLKNIFLCSTTIWSRLDRDI
jgi:hypothetical protein